MRLTEEQVRERLRRHEIAQIVNPDHVCRYPQSYRHTLNMAGVVWTGDHYEEVEDA